ncbi:MAG: phosphoribosylglycinamide formyltransferase [Candidatus Nanopelagicales bacterium]
MTAEPGTTEAPRKIVVLVSGTGTILQSLIDAERDSAVATDYKIIAVGADKPDIEGLARAERAGIPTFVVNPLKSSSRVEWDQALAERLSDYRPDWVVSAGFMRILGPQVLRKFPNRIINTHPSLLPSFPGAHAIDDALSHGVKVTGCTVHIVDSGVDTGPILAQVAVSVESGDDSETLHERVKQVERKLLIDTINQLCTQDQ